MSIKVKAIETDLSHFKDKQGNSLGFRYVLKPELYSKLSESKVIAEAALRSGVAKGVMAACWDAAGEVIKAWATEGHSVAAAKLISTRRIVFTPSVDLKDELKSASVSITCYDRNGEVVKRVTSTDDAEVEDPENENNGGENNGGTNTGGNTGGDNNGGGGNNGGVSND